VLTSEMRHSVHAMFLCSIKLTDREAPFHSALSSLKQNGFTAVFSDNRFYNCVFLASVTDL
jgi:hypothetical protein